MILGAPVLWLSSRLEFERLDGPVTMTVADLIERRNPVVVAGDGLPIDDAGPRPKPRQRLDDQRKALLRSCCSRTLRPARLLICSLTPAFKSD